MFVADSSQTSRYGFPYQPTCVAYDPVQSLLAIGSYDGSLRMYPLNCFCTTFTSITCNMPSYVIFRELVRFRRFVRTFILSESNVLSYLKDAQKQTTNVQKFPECTLS